MEFTGTVLWFDDKKGYGFIHDPTESKDVFVHYKGIISDSKYKTLFKGQIVKFEKYRSDKGIVAQNVVPVKKI